MPPSLPFSSADNPSHSQLGRRITPFPTQAADADTVTETRVMPPGEPPNVSSFEGEALAIAKGVAEELARRMKEVRD